MFIADPSSRTLVSIFCVTKNGLYVFVVRVILWCSRVQVRTQAYPVVILVADVRSCWPVNYGDLSSLLWKIVVCFALNSFSKLLGSFVTESVGRLLYLLCPWVVASGLFPYMLRSIWDTGLFVLINKTSSYVLVYNCIIGSGSVVYWSAIRSISRRRVL